MCSSTMSYSFQWYIFMCMKLLLKETAEQMIKERLSYKIVDRLVVAMRYQKEYEMMFTFSENCTTIKIMQALAFFALSAVSKNLLSQRMRVLCKCNLQYIEAFEKESVLERNSMTLSRQWTCTLHCKSTCQQRATLEPMIEN